MTNPKIITVDGIDYVPSAPATFEDHVLVRSANAGVFVGRLVARSGDEVTLADARRIWYWAGAATLSQLAIEGTTKPGECKFPPSVPEIVVLGVCEIISMTGQAVQSIAAVPEWRL